MSWYAAHLVMFARLKGNVRQQTFPVWENIVLIEADSEDEAMKNAEQHGHEEEGDDDGTFRWASKPAEWVFAGVRKITLCQDSQKRPKNGTELSYTELELGSEEAVYQLMEGEPVCVRFTDAFRTVTPTSS